MGKAFQHNQSNISIENSHPGCMWGFLHVLKYHHWRFIKKRFHLKSQGSDKHAGIGNPGNDLDNLKADRTPQHNNKRNDNSIVNDKKTKSTPAAKGSVKSRITALISDELSKRMGQHRRSSSYPVRSHLTRTESFHHIDTESLRHLEPSDGDPLPDIRLNDGSPTVADNAASCSTSLLNPLVPTSFEDQNHEDSGTMLTKNHLGHNQADESGKQLFENHPLLQENSDNKMQKLIHAKELNTDASDQQLKEIVDALNMINMDKEFFLKILRDPGSPLAHRFHNQQAIRTKIGYSKSVSFPLRGSSYRRGSGSSKFKQKQEVIESSAQEVQLQADSQTQKSVEPKPREYIHSKSMSSITADCRANGILKLNPAIAEIAANSSSGSAHHPKNHGQNQVVIRRFKDLKHKIKHVIRESKNEKNRITMEAILHKIPHGHRFSKETKDSVDNMKDYPIIRDGKDSPRSSYDRDYSIPSTSKSESRGVGRALSFSELLDKYCQLYESSFNREVKHNNYETLKLRKEDAVSPIRSASKSMRRIISLPDLKSYSNDSEDSIDPFSSIQDRAFGDGTMSVRSDFSEQKSLGHPIASEYLLQLDTKCQLNNYIRDNLDSEMYSVVEDLLGTMLVANIKPAAIAGLTGDELGNLMTGDRASDDNQDIQPPTKTITELAEPSTPSVSDSKFQEDTTIPADFSISEDSEPSARHLLPNKLDSLEDQPAESSMDTPIVTESRVETVEFTDKNLKNDILQFQVDAKDQAEFDYVKDILELSGFSGNELLGTWHSDDQPVDPSMISEMEGCMLFDPECSGNEEGGNCYHLLLFDLINEVLMEIYAKSYTYYPKSLSTLSHIRPMPVGYHVLEEVWATISWYLTSCPKTEHVLDYVVHRDLAKCDGWMNLQFDTECVVLELEDLIFDDLLEDVICTCVSG